MAFNPEHRSLSLTALSLRAGLPKASALRIIRKLVEWGALERASSGEYVIGLRLVEVAALAPGGHALRAVVSGQTASGDLNLAPTDDPDLAAGGDLNLAPTDDPDLAATRAEA
jgi:DNA-binding IclR family transcriptional regulator